MPKAKTRSFSIYLLKPGFNDTNSLDAESRLRPCSDVRALPAGASMFIMDSIPTAPWWKAYFDVGQELLQSHKGAIVFLPVRDRWCAITFGHVANKLKNNAYEYDFGLRVTLNCVQPGELRSTDTLEPGVARRQRTQLPTGSPLVDFDIDKDSSILKGLTGKVMPEYSEYFKHATGASNVRISTDRPSADLTKVCEQLLDIYAKDDYMAAFPDIRAIEPVKDPDVLVKLEQRLMEAFRSESVALTLSVPELLDYRAGLNVSFGGGGRSELFDDVAMPYYYKYLKVRGIRLDTVDIDLLRKHKLHLCDQDGQPQETFRVFDCLIFDSEIDGTSPHYHLCDGQWYALDRDFVAKLQADLDPYFVETTMPDFDHEGEGEYNEAVAAASPDYICLDKKNIARVGQTPIEPCDLFSVEGPAAVHTHVKISTRSQLLSHLFNQGLTAIEAIRLDPEMRQRYLDLVRANLGGRDGRRFTAPIEADNHCVVYSIVTHKPAAARSKNLPLFSQISLRRAIRQLTMWKVGVRCCYVPDRTMEAVEKASLPVPGAAAPGEAAAVTA